jgi:hypothetical protein
VALLYQSGNPLPSAVLALFKKSHVGSSRHKLSNGRSNKNAEENFSIMSTSRKPKAKAQPARPSPNTFKGFANISLTDSAKEDIINECENEGVLERHLDNLISCGYKVSFSYSDDEGSYCATATGGENSGNSQGYATSARSEDIVRALLALSAKVIVIADGDISSFAVARRALSDI